MFRCHRVIDWNGKWSMTPVGLSSCCKAQGTIESNAYLCQWNNVGHPISRPLDYMPYDVIYTRGGGGGGDSRNISHFIMKLIFAK